MTVALADLRDNWFVACASRDVRARPIGRVVLGTPLVLFRTAAGISALLDRCPHRNRALSEGTLHDGLLRCAYHGWTFDGAGRCRDVPGLSGARELDRPALRATPFPAVERDGFVWVLLAGEPPATRFPLPDLAPPEAARFARFTWTVRIACALEDAVENVLDPAHPHFVHRGIIRSERRRPTQVTIRRDAAGVCAEYRGDGASAGWISRLLEGERVVTVARYLPPATARLEYSGSRGLRFSAGVAFTPVDENALDAHALIAVPRSIVPAALTAVAVRTLFGPVVRQDVRALERQHRNLARFGEAAYTSTALDVMRTHIVRALRPPSAGDEEPFEQHLVFEL